MLHVSMLFCLVANGLAKLRGRFKESPYQTARKQAA